MALVQGSKDSRQGISSEQTVEARRTHDDAFRERTSRGGSRLWLLAAGVLSVGLVWSYWPTLVGLYDQWQHNQDYSAGQLVPLLALYFVWLERKNLPLTQASPCLWGLLIIVLAMMMRLAGRLLSFGSAEYYSLPLTLVGIVLAVLGPTLTRRLGWVLLFLFLMVPLPRSIHALISSGLQELATSGAVLVLKTIGVVVSRQGNVMVLGDGMAVGVAEACSGLRMLTAFVIVASTVAYYVHRPRWQKAILLVSSGILAIVCNLARLCITAFLYMYTSSQIAERFLHDFAGLAMMPLAVLLLVVELVFLDRLFGPSEKTGKKTA